MPKSSFKGKVIWITGASSGIGEATARRFARAGSRLILSARREDELKRVAATCSSAESVSVLPLDLGIPDTMSGVVGQALKIAGHVDVMVHNGGVSQRAFAPETVYEVDERIMRTNYLGPIALTKALLPSMQARRQGHFVVLSSVLGKFGLPGRSAYCASKHALHGFFDTLRAEVWKDGIQVTLILPGWVRTNISRNALTANGSPNSVMEPGTANGVGTDFCAERIFFAAESGKREANIVKLKESAALYLKRIAPGVFARIIRNRDL